jgi:SHS2 domain-containing protein
MNYFSIRGGVRRVEKAFDIIDHTADIGIISYGADLKMVFSNAALGLFSLITDLNIIDENIQRQVQISSQDRESLLVDWLNELIYLFDTERVVFSRFEFDTFSEVKLTARCFGNSINPKQQTIKREVKAATYHMLAINKEDDHYKAQIIFDI